MDTKGKHIYNGQTGRTASEQQETWRSERRMRKWLNTRSKKSVKEWKWKAKGGKLSVDLLEVVEVRAKSIKRRGSKGRSEMWAAGVWKEGKHIYF